MKEFNEPSVQALPSPLPKSFLYGDPLRLLIITGVLGSGAETPSRRAAFPKPSSLYGLVLR